MMHKGGMSEQRKHPAEQMPPRPSGESTAEQKPEKEVSPFILEQRQVMEDVMLGKVDRDDVDLEALYNAAKEDDEITHQLGDFYWQNERLVGLIRKDRDPRGKFLFLTMLPTSDQTRLAEWAFEEGTFEGEEQKRHELFFQNIQRFEEGSVPLSVLKRILLLREPSDQITLVFRYWFVFKLSERSFLEEVAAILQYNDGVSTQKRTLPRIKDGDMIALLHQEPRISFSVFRLLASKHQHLLRRFAKNIELIPFDAALRVLNLEKADDQDLLMVILDRITGDTDLSEAPQLRRFVGGWWYNRLAETYPGRFATYLHQQEIARDFASKHREANDLVQVNASYIPKSLAEDESKRGKLLKKHMHLVSRYVLLPQELDRSRRQLIIETAVKTISDPEFFWDFLPQVKNEAFQQELINNVARALLYQKQEDPVYMEPLVRHMDLVTDPSLRTWMSEIAKDLFHKSHDVSLFAGLPEAFPSLSKVEVEKAATNGHIELLFRHWDKVEGAGYTKAQIVKAALKHKRYAEVATCFSFLGEPFLQDVYEMLWQVTNKELMGKTLVKDDPRKALVLQFDRGMEYGNEVAEGIIAVGERRIVAEGLSRFRDGSLSDRVRESLLTIKNGVSFEEEVERFAHKFAGFEAEEARKIKGLIPAAEADLAPPNPTKIPWWQKFTKRTGKKPE